MQNAVYRTARPLHGIHLHPYHLYFLHLSKHTFSLKERTVFRDFALAAIQTGTHNFLPEEIKVALYGFQAPAKIIIKLLANIRKLVVYD